jgi:hypothetical protein
MVSKMFKILALLFVAQGVIYACSIIASVDYATSILYRISARLGWVSRGTRREPSHGQVAQLLLQNLLLAFLSDLSDLYLFAATVEQVALDANGW